MGSKRKADFERACIEYLKTLSLNDLRAYGRFLGLPTPTKPKKLELIKEIVEALNGEKEYARTKRGAPIKNDYFPKEILLELDALREKYFGKSQKEEKADGETVVLQFSVIPAKLSEGQRKLLYEFLNSL